MKDTVKDLWEAVDRDIWVISSIYINPHVKNLEIGEKIHKPNWDWETAWTKLKQISIRVSMRVDPKRAEAERETARARVIIVVVVVIIIIFFVVIIIR